MFNLHIEAVLKANDILSIQLSTKVQKNKILVSMKNNVDSIKKGGDDKMLANIEIQL